MSRILFLLVPGVHLLDLAGPAQVFSTAADFGYDYTLGYVAEQPVVTSAQGVPLQADTDWPELVQDDLLLVPGWRSPSLQLESALGPDPLRRLREHHAAGGTVASVCAGADALGRAGLLDGRRCTTHWRHTDELAKRFPEAELDPDVLFVDDGEIITSAGTAAGIDACLHLVRRELGTAAATAIARRMVVPPQRDGGQRQYVAAPIPECEADSLEPLLSWMLETLDTEHTVASLARRAQLSTRTLARRFAAETGTTPQRWLATQPRRAAGDHSE